MRRYFSRWCYWCWYLVELRQRHRRQPLLTLLMSLWEGNVLFKQFLWKCVESSDTKTDGPCRYLPRIIWRQIHAGLGMYTSLFTRVHIISNNICKFQNNNSIMSGCTTWYSLVRRRQLSQPCRVRYGGQHIRKINANSQKAFVVGFPYDQMIIM